jgi:pimeloyl-ACP methyl ester carboxylesterase
MPFAPADGARIHYTDTGRGTPIVFVHEYDNDHRCWDDQVRHFARGWRCIAMSARGYPPSDVPDDPALYGQPQFTNDVVAVMNAAGIDRAHIVGLSMGGYAALMVAIEHPGRVRSIVPAAAGSGATAPAFRNAFRKESEAIADAMLRAGRIDAEAIGVEPRRVQLQAKDPMAWRAWVDRRAAHPVVGAASTRRKVQALRPPLYDFESQLRALAAPTLLVVGDEDEPCLDVNLWMKRLMPTAQLVVLPQTGHAVNVEEPALFNALLERFITAVDLGQWRPRDPRSQAAADAVRSGLGPVFK